MFSEKTIDFLSRLAQNNQREWFGAHQDEYQRYVCAPALQFIGEMAKPLATMAPAFRAEAKKIGGSLMRIHRDVRFARDKSPYKTNIGIHFRHHLGKDVHAPGFYVHIDPDECFIGAGIWHPQAPALGQIRTAIVQKSAQWQALCANQKFAQSFTLGGDSLVRVPRGFSADHPCADDLRRKDFIAIAPTPPRLIFDKDFPIWVARQFNLAIPFMQFLCLALSAPWRH